jgi:cobalt/nickel transport system permease protein
VGLLLVRGMERAERVLAAMKCRAFDGRFRELEGFAVRRADVVFAIAAVAHVAAWIWIDHL